MRKHLKKEKDIAGKHRARVELNSGQTVVFKFATDPKTKDIDDAADAYEAESAVQDALYLEKEKLILQEKIAILQARLAEIP